MRQYSPRLWSAIFLVAGTCIGGGMLALPVASAQTGFLLSVLLMILTWVMMILSALYLIEIGFWMKKDEAHIISMSKKFLGRGGENISWLLFLFISYASLIAYTAGCGTLFSKIGTACFGTEISKTIGCCIFMLFFGPVLLMRHVTLGKINSVLFFAMVAAYIILISLSSLQIKTELILRADWKTSLSTLPLLLTAFSFQTMVPSLHPFLQHDKPSLKIAIICGTSIALLFYIIWQAVVLGTVPFEGPTGLSMALSKGEAATNYLGGYLHSPLIEVTASFFSFFALVTSFLGIGLGLFDFLSDGCAIPKRGWGTLSLALLICIPTLFFAAIYERVFLVALDMTGGFGDALMNGIIPVLMVFMGRYVYKHLKSSFQVVGGKSLLILTGLFYALVLCIEILARVL